MMVRVHGTVASGFERAYEAFAANFQRPGEFEELGASFAVYVGGRNVVNLHGGFRDADRSQPWSERTLANVWSATKGVVALAVAQLVEAGRLDYARPVADYWPEFAAGGKASTTVAHVLSHRAGLNGFAETTTPTDLYDWDLVTNRLARQAAFWEPGTLSSYHAMTFGWLTGELIRHVSGMEVRDYLRQRIAGPLQADLWLGLPASRREDVAEIVPPQPDREPILLNDIARRAIINPVPDANEANTEAWRNAQLPAVNVHATADGLARVYSSLANGGTFACVRLLSAEGVESMRSVFSEGPDQMLGARKWGAGVALNTGGLYGPNPRAFGHSGWGGSFGCADPENGVAMAYVVNRMGSKLNGDPRAQSLCEAVYDSLAQRE